MTKHIEVGPTMARRVIVLFAGKMSMLLFSLIFAVVGPKMLGPRGIGFYSYLYAIIFVMWSVLDAGGAMVLRRYVPDLLSRSPDQIRPLFMASLKAKALMVIVFLLALPLTPDPLMYALALFAASFSTLVDSAQVVLYTGGALIAYALIPAAWAGARLVLVLLLGYHFQRIGISMGLLIAPAILLVVFWPRATHLIPSSHSSLRESYWRFLKFGLVSYVADLSFVLSNRIAVILSKSLMDDMAEVGFLGYAFMIYLMARQLAFVIGETSLPTLVRYHARGETDQFSRTMYHVWRYTNILVFAAALLILRYANPVITHFIDPAFARSALLTRLLVPALIATTLTLCLRIPLFVRERSSRLLIAHGSALVVFILLLAGFRWIHKGTILTEHVAGFFSISTVVGLLLMAFNAGTRIPLGRLLWAFLKPAMAAAGTYVILLRVFPGDHTAFFLSVPAAVAVYLLLLFMVRGMETRDRERLMELIGRRSSDQETADP